MELIITKETSTKMGSFMELENIIIPKAIMNTMDNFSVESLTVMGYFTKG